MVCKVSPRWSQRNNITRAFNSTTRRKDSQMYLYCQSLLYKKEFTNGVHINFLKSVAVVFWFWFWIWIGDISGDSWSSWWWLSLSVGLYWRWYPRIGLLARGVKHNSNRFKKIHTVWIYNHLGWYYLPHQLLKVSCTNNKYIQTKLDKEVIKFICYNWDKRKPNQIPFRGQLSLDVFIF